MDCYENKIWPVKCAKANDPEIVFCHVFAFQRTRGNLTSFTQFCQCRENFRWFGFYSWHISIPLHNRLEMAAKFYPNMYKESNKKKKKKMKFGKDVRTKIADFFFLSVLRFHFYFIFSLSFERTKQSNGRGNIGKTSWNYVQF